ncbi:hypothetical protein SAMN06297468_2512 [Altererythrobacter xiamenensis]|uniref:Uncharacterized protein n=1 Tax=Altererythrobacter xiamenensis TaxID=1316679 RepID=A0A1Y6FL96_9SPHN|nr:hypothetical protein SAMN06297468_2512 [Altererythrobacter xiamenensis]
MTPELLPELIPNTDPDHPRTIRPNYPPHTLYLKVYRARPLCRPRPHLMEARMGGGARVFSIRPASWRCVPEKTASAIQNMGGCIRSLERWGSMAAGNVRKTSNT